MHAINRPYISATTDDLGEDRVANGHASEMPSYRLYHGANGIQDQRNSWHLGPLVWSLQAMMTRLT